MRLPKILVLIIVACMVALPNSNVPVFTHGFFACSAPPLPACVDRDCDFFEEVGSVANVKNKQNIFADPFIWHRHECNAGRLPPNCVERGPQARPASTRILG